MNSLLFLLSNLQMLEMQRTVSACSYAASERDKPGDAEIRSPTELVVAGLAGAWLAFSCVRKVAGA